MEKREVSLKAKIEQEKVISYLEDLISSMKEGTICVQQGTDIVTLKPSKFVEMELEASIKKNKERFALELTWRVEKEEEEPEFSISSSEPVAVGENENETSEK
ncbi:MAG: amphi-Trp domain-containing protein [Candidatus Nitronauta litoralis]|uniref:Amphi-Trp domain-containing protein n=1 Tax=Candidatus Nitronauta litoralis TaxID=2705533 RepID=A0A7T0BX45_9BACT|nr:MAG: amphi-Trp domain-containing protein [Candidatus Nitronauta litoralis]